MKKRKGKMKNKTKRSNCRKEILIRRKKMKIMWMKKAKMQMSII